MITVSNDSTSNYYVKVTNMGAYVAYYNLWYYVNGKYSGFQSPLISVLESHTMSLPANAIDIHVQVNAYVVLQLDETIAEVSFDKPSQICLTSYGTTFRGWVTRTPCSGLGSLPGPSQCPAGTVPVCLPACKPIICNC